MTLLCGLKGVKMSTYVREKVLRIPFDRLFPAYYPSCEWVDCDEFQDDPPYYLEHKFPELFEYAEPNKFQVAPTEDSFIDFVLEYERDCDGEYGKIRELYDTEREKFFPLFKKLNPEFVLADMKSVRLVEFCWYNGTEAPSYYEFKDDPFYKEII